MEKPVQKRTLQTRSKLVAAAKEIIAESGYGALRVEEVVSRANTAKGTFFAHFKDKDALMDMIIGAEIDKYLDELETKPAPKTVEEMVKALNPLCQFMTCERYVFDIILRYSGAAAVEEIGSIATTFFRHEGIFQSWLNDHPFRKDVPSKLQAEGVTAFMVQAMGSHFCALHNDLPIHDRLLPYLKAWLTPA